MSVVGRGDVVRGVLPTSWFAVVGLGIHSCRWHVVDTQSILASGVANCHGNLFVSSERYRAPFCEHGCQFEDGRWRLRLAVLRKHAIEWRCGSTCCRLPSCACCMRIHGAMYTYLARPWSV